MHFEQTFTFHAYAGPRRSGKQTAHDAWVRAHSHRLHLAGVIADPIEITAHDLETADPADLRALAAGAWLPGVTTQTVIDTFGRRIVRVSSVPCVTTVGT